MGRCTHSTHKPARAREHARRPICFTNVKPWTLKAPFQAEVSSPYVTEPLIAVGTPAARTTLAGRLRGARCCGCGWGPRCPARRLTTTASRPASLPSVAGGQCAARGSCGMARGQGAGQRDRGGHRCNRDDRGVFVRGGAQTCMHRVGLCDQCRARKTLSTTCLPPVQARLTCTCVPTCACLSVQPARPVRMARCCAAQPQGCCPQPPRRPRSLAARHGGVGAVLPAAPSQAGRPRGSGTAPGSAAAGCYLVQLAQRVPAGECCCTHRMHAADCFTMGGGVWGELTLLILRPASCQTPVVL